MTTCSSIQLPPGDPTNLSARLPGLLHAPLGNRPFRRLSQALIILLLLIAPVSYSTDTIPNFKPDCETFSPLREKTTKNVAVARRSGSSPSRLSHEIIIPFSLLFSSTPPQSNFQLSNRGRAPPPAPSPTR